MHWALDEQFDKATRSEPALWRGLEGRACGPAALWFSIKDLGC